MKVLGLSAVLLLGAVSPGGYSIYDGPSVGFDVDFMVAGDSLSATWTTPPFDHFEWAIGTTSGGSDIQPFTNIGTTSFATSSAVAVAGTLYYVTVNSVDATGSVVVTITSDGVTAIGPSSITATPPSGAAALLVQFAAQLPGVVLYEWDVDLPAQIYAPKAMAFSSFTSPGLDYVSATDGNFSFMYTLPGDYDATLTLTHAGGEVTSKIITISVAAGGSAPSVIPDKIGGPAPLTVTLTAALTSPGGVYLWDFDGDGAFDASSDSSPTIVHTFTEPKIAPYPVTVSVLDPAGGAVVSPPIFIDVQFPAVITVPNVPAPLASGGSRTGEIVIFDVTADAGGTGSIVSYAWDFDGNGEVDLITTAGTATWQYREPGAFLAKVTVTDDEGLSASNTAFLTIIADPVTPRVWIVEPATGSKVAGNFVTITALAEPAAALTSIDFYCRQAGSGPASFPDPSWGTPINPTPILAPPTTEFGTHLDVGLRTQGPPGLELLAVAVIGGQTVTSLAIQAVVVEPNTASPDIVENSGSPFTKLKTQGVNPNATTQVGISRDTTFQLQAGTTTGYDQMRVERRSENPHPVETNLQALRFVPGHFRRKTFVSGQKLQKPSKVQMYLNTGGSDILPDGTDLNASTFKIMRFNDATLRWEPLYGQTFTPSQKLIKAFSASTGDIGIAVVSTRVSGSSSSSGGCGLMGLEALFAGLAAAALSRRLRRRA